MTQDARWVDTYDPEPNETPLQSINRRISAVMRNRNEHMDKADPIDEAAIRDTNDSIHELIEHFAENEWPLIGDIIHCGIFDWDGFRSGPMP